MSAIQEIVTRIDEILINKQSAPAYVIGGYIVGATIARDDYEELSVQYPLLETVAELGAELETLDGNEAAKILRQIINPFETLKTQVNTA